MLRSLKPAGLLFFYILWTYHPLPWSFGPLDMTAGWFGLITFQDRDSCEMARLHAWNEWTSTPGLKTKCLADNVEPSPIAKVIQ